MTRQSTASKRSKVRPPRLGTVRKDRYGRWWPIIPETAKKFDLSFGTIRAACERGHHIFAKRPGRLPRTRVFPVTVVGRRTFRMSHKHIHEEDLDRLALCVAGYYKKGRALYAKLGRIKQETGLTKGDVKRLAPSEIRILEFPTGGHRNRLLGYRLSDARHVAKHRKRPNGVFTPVELKAKVAKFRPDCPPLHDSILSSWDCRKKGRHDHEECHRRTGAVHVTRIFVAGKWVRGRRLDEVLRRYDKELALRSKVTDKRGRVWDRLGPYTYRSPDGRVYCAGPEAQRRSKLASSNWLTCDSQKNGRTSGQYGGRYRRELGRDIDKELLLVEVKGEKQTRLGWIAAFADVDLELIGLHRTIHELGACRDAEGNVYLSDRVGAPKLGFIKEDVESARARRDGTQLYVCRGRAKWVEFGLAVFDAFQLGPVLRRGREIWLGRVDRDWAAQNKATLVKHLGPLDRIPLLPSPAEAAKRNELGAWRDDSGRIYLSDRVGAPKLGFTRGDMQDIRARRQGMQRLRGRRRWVELALRVFCDSQLGPVEHCGHPICLNRVDRGWASQNEATLVKHFGPLEELPVLPSRVNGASPMWEPIQPDVADEESDATPPPTSDYLGLVFDDSRVIKCNGYDRTLDLSDNRLLWHLFLTYYRSRESFVHDDAIRALWPMYGREDNPEPGTVKGRVSELRTLLRRFGVTIETNRKVGRRLARIS